MKSLLALVLATFAFAASAAPASAPLKTAQPPVQAQVNKTKIDSRHTMLAKKIMAAKKAKKHSKKVAKAPVVKATAAK